jgi:hypothetical protein
MRACRACCAADGKAVKGEWDKAVLALLGEKTEADKTRKPKKAAPADSNTETKEAPKKAAGGEAKAEVREGSWLCSRWHASIVGSPCAMRAQEIPDDFLEAREIPWARNTEEQLKAHLKATGPSGDACLPAQSS